MDIATTGILVIPDDAINKELLKYKHKMLPAYRKRLLKLIEIARAGGMDPCLSHNPPWLARAGPFNQCRYGNYKTETSTTAL